jgi:hypothetical protein
MKTVMQTPLASLACLFDMSLDDDQPGPTMASLPFPDHPALYEPAPSSLDKLPLNQ